MPMTVYFKFWFPQNLRACCDNGSTPPIDDSCWTPSEDHPASETPSVARNRSNYGAWLGHDAADAGPESRGLLPHPATGEPYEPSPTSQAWAPSMASTLALV